MLVMAQCTSSQARTDTQAQALICSREPKAVPERDRARIKAENRDCVVNVRGHKSRTEVLALLCATRPRVPKPLCGTPVLDDPNVGGDNST